MFFKFSPFWHSVYTVVSGTVIAQAIPMIALLALTRIVNTADLGNFFLWFAASSIPMLLASASIDKAIFLADKYDDITDLLKLNFFISSIVALITFVIISVVKITGYSVVSDVIKDYAASFATYSFIMSLQKNLQSVIIYRSEFKLLNKSKLTLAGSVALGQLVTGLLGLGIKGLIYSTVLLSGLSTLLVMQWLNISFTKLCTSISLPTLKHTLLENYKFIVFSLPAELINLVASQIPIFTISARFGAVHVAMYSLVLRVMAVPIGLLGNSVLTVFKDQAARDFREQGNCKYIYVKTLKYLSILSCLPFLLLYLFGHSAFKLLFGEEFGMAGEYASTLAIVYFFIFISSPLSYVLFFSDQGKLINLFSQVTYCLIVIFVFTYSDSINNAILNYAIFGSVYYLIYLFLSYRSALGFQPKNS